MEKPPGVVFAAREREWVVAVLLCRHVVTSEESPSCLLRGRGWGVAASLHCRLGETLPVAFAAREREWGVATLLPQSSPPCRVFCKGVGVGCRRVAASPRCRLGGTLPIAFAAREREWGITASLAYYCGINAIEEGHQYLLFIASLLNQEGVAMQAAAGEMSLMFGARGVVATQAR